MPFGPEGEERHGAGGGEDFEFLVGASGIHGFAARADGHCADQVQSQQASCERDPRTEGECAIEGAGLPPRRPGPAVADRPSMEPDGGALEDVGTGADGAGGLLQLLAMPSADAR